MGINADFRQELQPTLQELEDIRLKHKDTRKKRQAVTIISWLVLVIMIAVTIFLLQDEVPLMMWGLLVGTFIVAIVASIRLGMVRRAFHEEFKSQAYCKVVQAIQPSAQYRPKQFMNKALYDASSLLPRCDRYSGDDYFFGTLENGCPYEFSEVYAEEEQEDISTDAEGNVITSTTYRTVFQGLLFSITTPFQNSRKITILPDTAERNAGTIGKFLQKTIGSLFKGRQDMVYFEEHPAFEEQFVVYSDSEEEARRLLTYPVLQALHELHNRYKRGIQLSFIDNRIFLSLPLTYKQSLFAPDIDEKVTENSFINRLTKELSFCFDLLEELGRIYDLSADSKTTDPSTHPSNNPFLITDQEKKPEDRSGNFYKKSSSKDNPFLL